MRVLQLVTQPSKEPVGALWGVDRQTRSNLPSRGCINDRSARALQHSSLDVLLTHDSPAGAMHDGANSEAIQAIIRTAQPRCAFLGHYCGAGQMVEGDFGGTRVYHMAGMELRRRRLYPEEGCVGVLRWANEEATFEYIGCEWLMRFPRANWLTW